MNILNALIIFFFLPLILAQDFPNPLASNSNNKILIPGTYRLFWNYTKTHLTGEIHVKTTGWVGFGLSPNGGMPGSDVFVYWVDSTGRTNFTDRFITSDKRIDKQQDWYLLSSQKSNGFNIVQFSRKIETCDAYEQDITIETGSPFVIFSWNDQIPSLNGDISYHGFDNRGFQAIPLISSLNEELQITPEDNIETYNFNVNVRTEKSKTLQNILSI
jgi:hypothetical protein